MGGAPSTLGHDGALLTMLGEKTALVAVASGGARIGWELVVDRRQAVPLRGRSVVWQRKGGERPEQASAVLLRLPAPGRLALKSSGRPRQVAPVELRALAAAIAADAGREGFLAVVDSLVELLLADGPVAEEIAAAALLADAAATDAGCIEVVARPTGDPSYIQGWSSDLPAGRLQVIALAGQPFLAQLFAATFQREDLGERGAGFAAIVRTRDRKDAPVAGILFRGPDGWRRIRRYERTSLLEPQSVPGHVRNILQRAHAPEDVLATLRAATQRFEGIETVSRLREPVRLGIDHAFLAAGAGVLVSGWVLDPDRRVEAVLLNGPLGSVRISDDWTRLARRDVTAAFQAEPLFRGLDPSRHGHGFIAYAPAVADETAAAGVHVELRLKNGASAFFPINPAPMAAQQALRKMIASIDPKAGFTLRAAERQFAPVLQATKRRPATAAEVSDLGFNEDRPLALVIGADERLGDVKTLLALLGLDPEARGLPIVLAGPAEGLMQSGGELRRLAGFYGLRLRLVGAEGVGDVLDAMEAGVAACRAPDVVLLSAQLLPTAPGWIGALERVYRRRRGAVVSPTILFEDGSLRWAGMQIRDTGRGRELASMRLGRRPKQETEPVESATASLECCLLSRTAFEAVGGFVPGYLGTVEKAAEMGLRLRLGGSAAIWVPSVRMIGADDAGAGAPNAEHLHRSIDRLVFDKRLSLALANLGADAS